MAVGVQVGVSTAARNRAALEKRLITLRGKWAAGNRPADKPVGRWLGDFLDQPTTTGLLDTELELLEGCANGTDANTRPGESSDKEETEADKVALRNIALNERKKFLWHAVSEHRVRAGFLRFMILGGDNFAPVHEAGIQLWNAWVDGNVDLRSAKCISRIALTNCVIGGDWLMQDGSLDVLVLRGSHVRRFRANRATISGAMWLDAYFISDAEVELFGIDIGGRLDLSYGHFEKGIAAPGAHIGGDLILSNATANAGISFVNADIGGSLIGFGAALRADDPNGSALDFSRSKIRGDALLGAAQISGAGWSKTNNRKAIDAQNIKVDGSVIFGGGFTAHGEVCFNGAEISKNLDFSAGIFHNEVLYAIRAEQSKVAGAIKLNPVHEPAGKPADEQVITFFFQSFGFVSLAGAQCGELNCDGGAFHRPGGAALYCATITVSGAIFLRNAGQMPFQAFGSVSLSSAKIGQNLECGGGRFHNEGGDALDCQASSIGGCVFLNGPCEPFLLDFKDYNDNDKDIERSKMAFHANGKVKFVAAFVGLQFNCQLGCFKNASGKKLKTGEADAALDLSACRIDDVLFLGREDLDDKPPAIEGSLDLTGATVRVLIDDGLVNDRGLVASTVDALWKAARGIAKKGVADPDDREGGLSKTVTGADGKPLMCTLSLDLFTYERLKGEGACDAGKRKQWLSRQPSEDLKDAFKPQPFVQLVNVMRNMGYDDDADDIALFRRQSEWRTKPWFKLWGPLRRARNFFFSKGSRLRAKQAWIVALIAVAALAACAYVGQSLHFRMEPVGVLAAVPSMAINHWPLAVAAAGLLFFRKFSTKLGEFYFLNLLIGYGFRMGRAVVLLLLLVGVFGSFYNRAFELGAIVPADRDVRDVDSKAIVASLGATASADKDVRKLDSKAATVPSAAATADQDGDKPVPRCTYWDPKLCSVIADQAIPLFNPWLYSADVMVPVVSFGQKAAWVPAQDVPIIVGTWLGTWQAPSNFVYYVQLLETVLGWIEGFLLVSFVTGLISKGGGGKDQ